MYYGFEATTLPSSLESRGAAIVFGAEFLGHGFGGGLASGDECRLLLGNAGRWSLFERFHRRRKSRTSGRLEIAESESKVGG